MYLNTNDADSDAAGTRTAAALRTLGSAMSRRHGDAQDPVKDAKGDLLQPAADRGAAGRMNGAEHPQDAVHDREHLQDAVHDRVIGDILGLTRNLGPIQVERILQYQRQHKLRFGEAAVALELVSGDDVLRALGQQFHYPYAPGAGSSISDELVVAAQPFSAQAEVFRGIRSHLLMRLRALDGVRRAVAVVSPDSGDGKTFFAANLAVALSQLGGTTLLVDADLRNPRLHDVFGVGQGGGGLSAILSGRAASALRPVPHLPSLSLLPVGTVPPNPLELVERPAFGLLVRDLLARFDHVVIDTAAGAHGADCSVIAAHSGAALAVARRGRSRMAALDDLVARLRGGPVQVLGVLLNER